jgi:hypothetical protein
MQECDLSKIALISRNGLYKYMLMSFGLTDEPTYFMFLIDKVFMKYLIKFFVMIINGILVHSKSEKGQRAKKNISI